MVEDLPVSFSFNLGQLLTTVQAQDSTEITRYEKREFMPRGYSFPTQLIRQLRSLGSFFKSKGLGENLSGIPINRDPANLISTIVDLHERQLLDSLSPEQIGKLLLICAESRYLRRYLLTRNRPLSNCLMPFRLPTVGGQATFTEIKYDGICQILGSDLAGEASLLETTANISSLFDFITLRVLETLSSPSAKAPLILAMGKWGGLELNYASDIDLIYVAPDPEPLEPIGRLIQQFGTFFSQEQNGLFLHRVDADLRPYGSRSPIVISRGALFRYLECHASTWEKYAYMKARPIQDDGTIKNEIAERIWSKYLDFRAIDHMKEIKLRIDYETTKHAFDPAHLKGWNVKLGSGGIREIEFFIQTLQMIYGGKKKVLREPRTLDAIERLHENGFIQPHQASILRSAYVAFRHLEHHLQCLDERRSYELPHDDIAYRNTIESFRIKEHELLEYRNAIIDLYRGLFSGTPSSQSRSLFLEFEAARAPEQFRTKRPLSTDSFFLLQALISPSSLKDFPEAARGALRSLLEQSLDILLNSSDPDRAIRGFDRFIRGIKGKAVFYSMLLRNPVLLSQLTIVFSKSPILTDLLLKTPDGLDSILLKRGMALKSYRKEARAILHDLLNRPQTDYELALDILRLFRKTEFLRIGFNQLVDGFNLDLFCDELSWVADSCLEEVYNLVRKHHPAAESIAIFGLGRLGERRLHIASDLDLVFLYSSDSAAPDAATRAVQRIISALSVPTREGILYQIDPRLRPSGTQGVLVSSLNAYSRFITGEIETWQRLTLFKLRPICGNRSLQDRALSVTAASIYPAPLSQHTIRSDIRLLIDTLRSEWRKLHKTTIKTEEGGLLEVDLLIQTLALSLKSKPFPASWDSLLTLAEAEELISKVDAELLRGSRLLFDRLLVLSSIIPLDDRAELALQLGYGSISEMKDDFHFRRGKIKAVIDRLLQEGES